MTEYNLSEKVIASLKDKSLTIFTAESCTGGLIAKMLTDVSGASSVVLGGVVSYTNEIKKSLLGVQAETIDAYTAVSEQCCYEMAEGARRVSGADIGVSTTGYASGGEGVPSDMAGVVYVGISDIYGTSVYRLQLSGNRDEVRRGAACELLETLIYRVEDYE